MPERRVPLTRVAHDHLRGIIRPGDLGIDATAGNGHDTLFLAQCVGPTGQVIAFDIQQAALDATRARLEAAGVADRCRLVLAGHERMDEHVPADWRGRVAAVMFNLGYLPGGDKAVVTRGETTVVALDAALGLIAPRGVISVITYRQHPGASDEKMAIGVWRTRLPALTQVQTQETAGPAWHRIAISP